MQLIQLTSDVNQFSSASASLSLWPLPANDVINVSYHSSTRRSGQSNLRLFNMNGALLMQEEIQNGQTASLTVSHLPSGSYLLQLANTKETLMKKVIIRR